MTSFSEYHYGSAFHSVSVPPSAAWSFSPLVIPTRPIEPNLKYHQPLLIIPPPTVLPVPGSLPPTPPLEDHHHHHLMSPINKLSPIGINAKEAELTEDTPKVKKFTSDFSVESLLSKKPVSKSQPQDFHIPPDLFYLHSPEILEKEASKVVPNADGNFVCYLCQKHYSRRHALKIHFRTHTGYKPLPCDICGKLFGDPSNLNKHKKVHKVADRQTIAMQMAQNIANKSRKLKLISNLVKSKKHFTTFSKERCI